MEITDITATDLQDDTMGPIIIDEHRKQVTKRMKEEKYMDILAFYFMSVFQDFEKFLRTEIDSVEDDFKLILDEENSSFVTYELQPGSYTFAGLSEAVFNILQLENPGSKNAIDIEIDDITRKSKLVVKPGIIAIRLDEKLFLSTILGFNYDWDHNHYNKDTSQKYVNFSTTNQIHLKCDVTCGSVVKGLRLPILYCFSLVKPAGYKIFSRPETVKYRKIKQSFLNTITFYLEDDNHDEIDFNGETLTFILQMIKF